MVTKSDIKYIQSLAHKKFRDSENLFVLEGVKIVRELLQDSTHSTKKIFAVSSWIEQYGSIVPDGVDLVEVEPFELERISFLQQPNEVLALVQIPDANKPRSIFQGITLVLDKLQDPGNLGTIIRTCDWFGVDQIVCSTDTADAYNPKVVQSAMGSIMRIDIFYTDIIQFLQTCKEVPSYAAVLDGQSYVKTTFNQPSILVIGNESKGISDEVLSAVSNKITIPGKGAAESLNAAVATAVILAEMTRISLKS
ncbi:MAG: TrmH family RNA methyltransferase [bacterium]